MNLREFTARADGRLKKKVRPFIMAVDRYSPYPLFYTFVMTLKERELFDKFIEDAKCYLEFGAGGSTIRVLQRSKAKIHSVESSLEWIKEMSRYVTIKYWRNKRVFFHPVAIGKTGMWGFPASDAAKESFPKYSSAIFDELYPVQPDVVLIDGRFRVACALQTILRLHSNEKTILLVHDFWNREEYHMILDFLTEIESADTLGVFRIKRDIDVNEVSKAYDHYKFIAD